VSGARRLVGAALAVLATALATFAAAQPYAADGGFDRARLIAREQARPVAVLALDRGQATLVRIEGDALVAEPLAPDPTGAGPRRLDAADGVRWAVADGGLDRPLVAVWYRRDPTTGQYVHAWTGGGGVLVRSVQPLDVVPVATDGAPIALVARGRGAEAVIERLDPAGAGEVLYRTGLRLSGLSAVADDDGLVHLTWLEGRTEQTPLGTRSTWTARAAALDPAGRLAGPVDLGAALGDGPPTVTTWTDGRVARMWIGSDGAARSVAQRPPDALAPNASTTELRGGRPLGVIGDAAFLTDEGTVWRVVDGASVPVAWSPLVVARAWGVRDADGVTHLAWVGTETGGQHALYVADDRTPMARTWRDELAARLGWSPWNVAEEAAGQLAASLLVAVLVAMGAAPLLLLAAALLAGRGSAAVARWRGAALGAGLGPATMLVAAAAGVAPATLWPLVGGAATLAVACGLGAIAGALAWMRRDMEPVPAFVTAGATAVAIAVAIVAFATFQNWLALTLV
jgi:hypothetical protein